MDRRSWLRALATLVGIVALALAAVAVDFSGLGRYTLSLWQPVTLHTGLGLGGGVHVLLQATNGANGTPSARAMERDRQIIAERLSAATDLAEPVVHTLRADGARYVSVKLPISAANLPAVQDLLQKTGKVTFIAIDGPPPAHPFVRKCFEKPHPPGVRDLTGDSAQGFKVLLQGNDIIPNSLAVGTDTLKGSPVVDASLTPGATARLQRYLAGSPAPFMGIAIDDKIYDVRPSAHVLLGLGGQFQIADTTGSICVMSLTSTTTDLVAILKYGPLLAPLRIAAVQGIGPQLPLSHAGVWGAAGLAALLIAVLALVVAYRMPGALAVAAVLIDVAIVVAIVKLVALTLTLAGLAGFALAVAIAADVQIVLARRVRRAQRAGRPAAAAVAEGLRGAWPVARDTAAVAMLASALLWWIGTSGGVGALADFAAVLFVGVAVAAATAFVASPTFLWLYTGIVGGRRDVYAHAGRGPSNAPDSQEAALPAVSGAHVTETWP